MRKINPTVKFAAVLIAAVLTAFSFSAKWNLILILFCLTLLLLSRANLRRLFAILIPVSLAALSLFFAMYLNGRGNGENVVLGNQGFYAMATHAGNLDSALMLALRIYAYALMAMLFALTTRTDEFIYSLMQQARLKPKFAYGVMAALNLLPVISRELGQIRLAYKVRGYRITFLSVRPIFSALVNTMHWSENVAMAMESKGFDGDGARTLYLQCRVRPLDIVWAAALIALSVCGVLGL